MPEPVAKQLEALIGHEALSEEYLSFRIALAQAQQRTQERIQPPSITTSKQQNQTTARPDGALLAQDVFFEPNSLLRLLEDLATALRTQNHPNSQLENLLAAADKNATLLPQLVSAAAFKLEDKILADWSEKLGLACEHLLFLCRALATPFVSEAVLRQKAHDLPEAAPSGTCPACGSLPGMSLLSGESGKRLLCCSLCGERWEFARITCPFCLDSIALGTLSVDAQDSSWIEICEQCHRYLKTIDANKRPKEKPINMLVESIATLYLDLIAEKEGYRAGPPYTALR